MTPLRVALVLAIGIFVAPQGVAGPGKPPGEVVDSSLIYTARAASRAVFAAQRAERRDAKLNGLVDLAAEIRELKKSIRQLGRVRLDAGSAAGSSASASSGNQAAEQARANLTGALARVRAKRRQLEARLGQLRAPRQRALATALLPRLQAIEQEVDAVLAGPTVDLNAVRRLAERMDAHAERRRTVQREIQPTFSTIVRHRQRVATPDQR